MRWNDESGNSFRGILFQSTNATTLPGSCAFTSTENGTGTSNTATGVTINQLLGLFLI